MEGVRNLKELVHELKSASLAESDGEPTAAAQPPMSVPAAAAGKPAVKAEIEEGEIEEGDTDVKLEGDAADAAVGPEAAAAPPPPPPPRPETKDAALEKNMEKKVAGIPASAVAATAEQAVARGRPDTGGDAAAAEATAAVAAAAGGAPRPELYTCCIDLRRENRTGKVPSVRIFDGNGSPK
jgi:hypothetical protein